MSKSRILTSVLALLAGLSAAGYALICGADESTVPSLLAIPVSPALIEKQLGDAYKSKKWDIFSHAENTSGMFTPPDCASSPADCFLIEYYDPWRFAEVMRENVTRDRFSETPNQPLEFSSPLNTYEHQIFLDTVAVRAQLGDWLGKTSKNCGKPSNRKSTACLALEKIGPNSSREIARSVFAQASQELLGQGRLSAATQAMILVNPLTYKDLPGLYKEAAGNPEGLASVEAVVHKALSQALKGLTRSAFSSLPAFPYIGGDEVVSDTFMTADWETKQLTDLEREVPIVPLTLEARKSLSGGCRDYPKTADDQTKECTGLLRKALSGRWKTLAAYSPNQNMVYVDYTEDFYEALYALQHEAWHAIVENTTESQKFRDRVEELAPLTMAKDPDLAKKSDLVLKQMIFYKLIQDELAAIQQSNWLYRFAGQLTHQWAEQSGKDTPSAKGWYDAEYGDAENEKLYVPRSLRILQEKTDRANAQAADTRVLSDKAADNPFLALLTITGIPDIISFHHKHVRQQKGKEATAIYQEALSPVLAARKALMERVLAGMPPEVLEVFSEKYRLTLPDFTDFEQKTKLAELTFEKPSPVRLTCEQAEHIISLMPAEWEHGLPFAFAATGPDGKPCPGPGGTLPGVNGGTHPDISFLPCLYGGKED